MTNRPMRQHGTVQKGEDLNEHAIIIPDFKGEFKS